MPTESELDVNCKIAGAKLGVAEQLRMPLSSLAGLLAYAYSNSWLIALGVGLAVLLIVPYWYSKEYDAAWDEYEKTTGTGKYFKPRQTNED